MAGDAAPSLPSGSLAHLFAESRLPAAPTGAFTFGARSVPANEPAGDGAAPRREAYVGAAPPSRKAALRITDSTDWVLQQQRQAHKSSPFDVVATIDKLRVRNDPQVLLLGLEDLHRALHAKGSLNALKAFHAKSDGLAVLLGAWDNARKGTVQAPIDDKLLLVLARVMALATPDRVPDVARDADELARGILRNRMKAVYHHLSSGARSRINGALHLLTAVAARGAYLARELVQVFDWSLSALRKLARPPRYKGDGDALADEEPSAVSMVGGRTYFVGRGILGRPTRPTFVLWALTLLRTRDGPLTAAVARCRPLISGLLHHASHDPPGVFLDILDTLETHVLGQGSASAEQVFDADSLVQLAAVYGTSSAVPGDATAIAARERCVALLRGLVVGPGALLRVRDDAVVGPKAPQVQPGAGQGGDPAVGVWIALFSAAARSGKGATDGRSTAAEMISRLRPAAHPGHAALVLEMAQSDMTAAGVALYGSNAWALEPAPSKEFFAAASLVCHLLRQSRGCLPGPGVPIHGASDLVRWLAPAPLTRAALTRGLQHAEPRVRAAAAELLQELCLSLESLLAAHPAGHLDVQETQVALQASLPDIQVLLAANASVASIWRQSSAQALGAKVEALQERVLRLRGDDGGVEDQGLTVVGKDWGAANDIGEVATVDGSGASAVERPNSERPGGMPPDAAVLFEELREAADAVRVAKADLCRVETAQHIYEAMRVLGVLLPQAYRESGADPTQVLPDEMISVDECDAACMEAAMALACQRLPQLGALQGRSLLGAVGLGNANVAPGRVAPDTASGESVEVVPEALTACISWVGQGHILALTSACVSSGCPEVGAKPGGAVGFAGRGVGVLWRLLQTVLLCSGMMGPGGALDATAICFALGFAGARFPARHGNASDGSARACASLASEVFAQAGKRPHVAALAARQVADATGQWTSTRLGPSTDDRAMFPSPFLCLLVEQGVKVLRSAKTPIRSRRAIADMLAAACAVLLVTGDDVPGAAGVAAALGRAVWGLEVARAGSPMDERGSLPAEAAVLAELHADCVRAVTGLAPTSSTSTARSPPGKRAKGVGGADAREHVWLQAIDIAGAREHKGHSGKRVAEAESLDASHGKVADVLAATKSWFGAVDSMTASKLSVIPACAAFHAKVVREQCTRPGDMVEESPSLRVLAALLADSERAATRIASDAPKRHSHHVPEPDGQPGSEESGSLFLPLSSFVAKSLGEVWLGMAEGTLTAGRDARADFESMLEALARASVGDSPRAVRANIHSCLRAVSDVAEKQLSRQTPASDGDVCCCQPLRLLATVSRGQGSQELGGTSSRLWQILRPAASSTTTIAALAACLDLGSLLESLCVRWLTDDSCRFTGSGALPDTAVTFVLRLLSMPGTSAAARSWVMRNADSLAVRACRLDSPDACLLAAQACSLCDEACVASMATRLVRAFATIPHAPSRDARRVMLANAMPFALAALSQAHLGDSIEHALSQAYAAPLAAYLFGKVLPMPPPPTDLHLPFLHLFAAAAARFVSCSSLASVMRSPSLPDRDSFWRVAADSPDQFSTDLRKILSPKSLLRGAAMDAHFCAVAPASGDHTDASAVTTALLAGLDALVAFPPSFDDTFLLSSDISAAHASLRALIPSSISRQANVAGALERTVVALEVVAGLAARAHEEASKAASGDQLARERMGFIGKWLVALVNVLAEVVPPSLSQPPQGVGSFGLTTTLCDALAVLPPCACSSLCEAAPWLVGDVSKLAADACMGLARSLLPLKDNQDAFSNPWRAKSAADCLEAMAAASESCGGSWVSRLDAACVALAAQMLQRDAVLRVLQDGDAARVLLQEPVMSLDTQLDFLGAAVSSAAPARPGRISHSGEASCPPIRESLLRAVCALLKRATSALVDDRRQLTAAVSAAIPVLLGSFQCTRSFQDTLCKECLFLMDHVVSGARWSDFPATLRRAVGGDVAHTKAHGDGDDASEGTARSSSDDDESNNRQQPPSANHPGSLRKLHGGHQGSKDDDARRASAEVDASEYVSPLSSLERRVHGALQTFLTPSALTRTGFLWGPAARRADEEGALQPAEKGKGSLDWLGDGSAPSPGTTRTQAVRRRAVGSAGVVDPRRLALGCAAMDIGSVGFDRWAPKPQRRMESREHGCEDVVGAGMDVHWALLFAYAGLQEGHLDVATDLSGTGLLPVILRAFGSQDVVARALGHLCFRLYCRHLSSTHFREKPFLTHLAAFVARGIVSHGITLASPVLPAAASFAAACAAGLQAHGSTRARAIVRVLRRKRAMRPLEMPHFYELVATGKVGLDGDQDRAQAMCLVWAGVAASVSGHTIGEESGEAGPAKDASGSAEAHEPVAEALRRHYAFEMLCGVHAAPSASWAMRAAVADTVSALARVPGYARDVVGRMGLLSWARDAVCDLIGTAASEQEERAASISAKLLDSLATALLSLQRIPFVTAVEGLGLVDGVARTVFACFHAKSDADRLLASLANFVCVNAMAGRPPVDSTHMSNVIPCASVAVAILRGCISRCPRHALAMALSLAVSPIMASEGVVWRLAEEAWGSLIGSATCGASEPGIARSKRLPLAVVAEGALAALGLVARHGGAEDAAAHQELWRAWLRSHCPGKLASRASVSDDVDMDARNGGRRQELLTQAVSKAVAALLGW